MDRNTLLAFFLIALVLLFTPKYLETFSPQTPINNTSEDPTSGQNIDTTTFFDVGFKKAEKQFGETHVKTKHLS